MFIWISISMELTSNSSMRTENQNRNNYKTLIANKEAREKSGDKLNQFTATMFHVAVNAGI